MAPSGPWMCWLVSGPVRPEYVIAQHRRGLVLRQGVGSRGSRDPELLEPAWGVSAARKSVPPDSEGGGGAAIR